MQLKKFMWLYREIALTKGIMLYAKAIAVKQANGTTLFY